MADFDNMASISGDGVGLMLQVLFFEEEGIIAAYAPALDLFGYGDSEKEALASFKIVLQEFVDYTTEQNSLEAELEKLGWDVKTETRRPAPPKVGVIIERNPTAADIYNNKDFRQQKQPVYAFG